VPHFLVGRVLLKSLDAVALRSALRSDATLLRHGAVASVCVLEHAGRVGKVGARWVVMHSQMNLFVLVASPLRPLPSRLSSVVSPVRWRARLWRQ
jgi:hypothetical protein